eukprot:GHVU01073995.1.p1 GENE.GHVU01073995.1~~GHVU01073995.1.p1  ORF type:complete len:123 (-),score=3.47 GHVU01073995.1:357-725(-)
MRKRMSQTSIGEKVESSAIVICTGNCVSERGYEGIVVAGCASCQLVRWLVIIIMHDAAVVDVVWDMLGGHEDAVIHRHPHMYGIHLCCMIADDNLLLSKALFIKLRSTLCRRYTIIIRNCYF